MFKTCVKWLFFTSQMTDNLVVCAVTSDAIDKAQRLARRLDLPFNSDPHHAPISLMVSAEDVSYKHPNFVTPFRVNFTNGPIAARISRGLTKREPLVKALALDPLRPSHILDATAGFGRDAMLIARYGQQITMLEKHAVIHELLADGLSRAFEQDEFCNLFTYPPDLIHSLAQQYLVAADKPVDVIYLDPMYPRRNKNLKVKKESQILQLLSKDMEHEDDHTDLLTWACSLARKRVVVKRPSWAEPLTKSLPTTAIYNQNTRYDVYIV